MIYLYRDKIKISVHSTNEIMTHFERCIENDESFSLIRFGDGGLKLINAYYTDDIKQLKNISIKEGIPLNKIKWLLKRWAISASRADYIDTPEVYFSKKFWGRYRKDKKEPTEKTSKLLISWKDIYDKAKFKNNSFCNPEFNYLCCLRLGERKNLLDVIKGKKVCMIATCPEIKYKFSKLCDMDIWKISGQYQDQYKKSYDNTILFIKNSAKIYDFWLICAGELGRLYSGMIRDLGGRCLDMGFVAEYWLNGEIPIRLKYFLRPNPKSRLEFRLTYEGQQYINWL